MTLYQINEQLRNAIEFGCDPETGEIIDTAAMEALEMARDEKIENICLYIKDLKAEAVALDNEKKALEARKAAAEKKSDSLSRYLQAMLDGEKFKTARCAVSYRKTQAVNIVDETLIPNEYLRFKTTSAPDKTAIKDAIKAGKDVPGAMLEERQSMTIK